jgi:hypothetical protein
MDEITQSEVETTQRLVKAFIDWEYKSDLFEYTAEDIRDDLESEKIFLDGYCGANAVEELRRDTEKNREASIFLSGGMKGLKKTSSQFWKSTSKCMTRKVSALFPSLAGMYS